MAKLPAIAGLKEEYKLTENIYPMIDNFLKERCIEDEKYFILLDANQTIAFMSGRILDIKTAKEIIPIQRTEKGLDSWEKKEVVNNQQAICKNESINNEENEVAVVISFSRDILNDVKAYLLEEKRKIGRIIDIRLAKINSSSVVDGTHAWELANQIKNIIDNRELSEKRSLLHIFMSCPNSVVFLLARYSLPFGKIQLYEYDFSGESTHTYYPTIMFPFDKKY